MYLLPVRQRLTYPVLAMHAFCELIATAVWFFDYLFTISREIDMLLSKTINVTVVLYLVNRYSFLGFILGQIISVVPGTMSDRSYVPLTSSTGEKRLLTFLTSFLDASA